MWPENSLQQPLEHLAHKMVQGLSGEKEHKMQEEAHLYMEVHIATEDHFKAHQGFDIVPWKADVATTYDSVSRRQQVLKSKAVGQFVTEWATGTGTDPRLFQPRAMEHRDNGTVRPGEVIMEPEMSVAAAFKRYGLRNHVFIIYMEKTEEKKVTRRCQIVLFLKHFDVEKQTLFGIGQFYADQQDQGAELAPKICEMLRWPAGTPFKMFEEIKPNMIESIKLHQTLAQSEIQNGDIITVHKSYSD
jgi:ubiquitin carboxyl-terminal hydrolase 7